MLQHRIQEKPTSKIKNTIQCVIVPKRVHCVVVNLTKHI